MEPETNAEYSRQAYWDARFAVEEEYDWFPSVYDAIVDEVVREAEAAWRHRGAAAPAGGALRVLHLGAGNSRLCLSLYEGLRAKGIEVHQVAVDFSPVVVERMAAKYPPSVLPNTVWRVMDVRDTAAVTALGPFDVVVDKSTMDTLQADRDNEELDGDLERMLRGVSAVLQAAHGYGRFLQVTWENPYFRLHITRRDAYAWGDQCSHRLLGDSDMYRIFVYTVQ